MEVGKLGRSSTSGRIEMTSINSVQDNVPKLSATSTKIIEHHANNNVHHQHQQTQKEKQKHPKERSMKMFNKVQVVYYLTRNGHLQHPHFIEVSHLATQPLRLKDVINRLRVLRGKAMPCQYSWSCKRRYKNGYVWNDLSENDVIYASEGLEYVLKGSELLLERDFSDTRLEDMEMNKRQQRKDHHMRTNGLMIKSNTTHQGQNHRETPNNNFEKNMNNNDEDNEQEDEEKESSNSSNAPYPITQIEQEESYSLPSTSSTNSDKQPPQTPQPPPQQPPPPPEPPEVLKPSNSESKRFGKEVSRVIEEDGDPTVSTSLTRNSAVLLHLIACGGGGILSPQGKNKLKTNNIGSNNRINSNFSMKYSFMPCLKQQLSTRGISTSHKNGVPPRIKGKAGDNNCSQGHLSASKEDGDEEEDDDMIMVKYISENPRFGNLQSEEKEYFSGTIVEEMAQAHHHHHHHSQLPVFTKSSSYNELRCSKGGLQAGGAASIGVDEDDEKDDAKFKGFIKLCIPRKKSFSSCTKTC